MSIDPTKSSPVGVRLKKFSTTFFVGRSLADLLIYMYLGPLFTFVFFLLIL